MASKKNILKKICMLGDFAVGKTSLIRRYVLDEFDDRYITTLGTKITKKDMAIENYHLVFQIWDIIGNIKYNKIQSQYYKGSDGAFLIFDITRKDTFDNLSRWADAFRQVAPKSTLLFIANKSDLEATFEYGQMLDDLAKGYDSMTFLTSAKTGENVEKAFQDLGRTVLGLKAEGE